MTVSLSLRQVTSTTSTADGPLYRVTHEITEAENISTAVFVFKTASQLFDHCAMFADLESYPDTYEQAVADSKAFYRASTVTRNWDTIALLEGDLAFMIQRVQHLANQLTHEQASLEIDRTTEIEGV